ncbi:MAG TPA: hypothetical protein VGJ26_12865 [Pirellulales bacterium]|jgi:hypothetical protein
MNTALLFLATAFVAAGPVEPLAQWDAMLGDVALKEAAPKAGFLADEKAFSELWKAWRPGEDVPSVDFSKELIIVGVANGPNRAMVRPTIDEAGDLKFTVVQTKRGGRGFGYAFLKMSREGVKTVNGQPIHGKGVQGALIAPDKLPSFADQKLQIQLWETDPKVADAKAKLIEEFSLEKITHKQGTASEIPFTIGGKLDPNPDRRYYITAFVLKDGQRTHIGEAAEKAGPTYVLTDGKPATVKLTLRAIGKE